MTDLMDSNIVTSDKAVRITAGIMLIASVLLFSAPAWLSLIATYPIFTALVEWDPLYSLARRTLPARKVKSLHKASLQPV